MILVTGATGFLGKRVCKLLDERSLEYQTTSLSLGLDLRDKEKTIQYFQKVQPEYVLITIIPGYDHTTCQWQDR